MWRSGFTERGLKRGRSPCPTSFARLRAAESDLGDLEGLSAPVRVCSLPDLLSMKRAAGRSVDLVDIERLIMAPEMSISN